MKNVQAQNAQDVILQKRWVLVVLLAVTTVTVLWCLFWLSFSPMSRTELFSNDDVTAGALPEITAGQTQMQREATEQTFSFKINVRPVFETGESAGGLRIENPYHNLYPIVVEIVENESGERIYDSGWILPEHHISEGTLAKVLPRGEHGATAYIYAFHPDTREYWGKATVDMILVVEH